MQESLSLSEGGKGTCIDNWTSGIHTQISLALHAWDYTKGHTKHSVYFSYNWGIIATTSLGVSGKGQLRQWPSMTTLGTMQQGVKLSLALSLLGLIQYPVSLVTLRMML